MKGQTVRFLAIALTPPVNVPSQAYRGTMGIAPGGAASSSRRCASHQDERHGFVGNTERYMLQAARMKQKPHERSKQRNPSHCAADCPLQQPLHAKQAGVGVPSVSPEPFQRIFSCRCAEVHDDSSVNFRALSFSASYLHPTSRHVNTVCSY